MKYFDPYFEPMLYEVDLANKEEANRVANNWSLGCSGDGTYPNAYRPAYYTVVPSVRNPGLMTVTNRFDPRVVK